MVEINKRNVSSEVAMVKEMVMVQTKHSDEGEE